MCAALFIPELMQAIHLISIAGFQSKCTHCTMQSGDVVVHLLFMFYFSGDSSNFVGFVVFCVCICDVAFFGFFSSDRITNARKMMERHSTLPSFLLLLLLLYLRR